MLACFGLAWGANSCTAEPGRQEELQIFSCDLDHRPLCGRSGYLPTERRSSCFRRPTLSFICWRRLTASSEGWSSSELLDRIAAYACIGSLAQTAKEITLPRRRDQPA